MASVQLQLRDFPASRKRLDESEQVLDTFDTVETVVHAAFYRVNAEYYKVMASIDIWGMQLTESVAT